MLGFQQDQYNEPHLQGLGLYDLCSNQSFNQGMGQKVVK
jgi:hypothetical protein